MNLPPDIYQHIALMSDDRDILNMLSVNKKFNDPEFFKRIISNKYPLTMRYKKDDENWKQFYLRIIKYIALAKEEFGFPYIPDWRIDPEEVYTELTKASEGKLTLFDNIWADGLRYAVYNNRLDLVKEITENGKMYLKNINYRNIPMSYAASNGNLEILNYLIDLYKPTDINFILVELAGKGNINLLNLFLTRGYQNINYNIIMEAAADGIGNIDIINMMLNLGADNYNDVLCKAAKRGHIMIVKLMLTKGADKLNCGLTAATKNNHIDIVKLLLPYAGKN